MIIVTFYLPFKLLGIIIFSRRLFIYLIRKIFNLRKENNDSEQRRISRR
jgi:hypothetical protein